MFSSNEKRNTFLTWFAFSRDSFGYIQNMNEGILNSLFLYWWAVLRLNFKKYDRERNTQEPLNDDNKILTETDTEAFFPKLKLTLFFRDLMNTVFFGLQ